jgi:hypothetical protein
VKQMNIDAEPTPSIELAAALLAAYLDRPDLPDRVEMRCLQAADELQRAGGTGREVAEAAGQVELDQVVTVLHSLPPEILETVHVLNAVWHLNAALDALAAA